MQGYTNARSISVIPLSVTENGTYTATLGSAYSPVTVNVSGGGGEPKVSIVEVVPLYLNVLSNVSLVEVVS